MSGSAGTPRPAAPHEREALGELLAELFEQHGPHPRFALAPDAEELGALLGDYLDHPDGRVFVVEVDQQLVGLVSVAIARRSAHFAERIRGHIDHLVVRRRARRAGVGRGLAEQALAWLAESGVSRVELQVDLDNQEGRAFWAALGFQPAMELLERRLPAAERSSATR